MKSNSGAVKSGDGIVHFNEGSRWEVTFPERHQCVVLTVVSSGRDRVEMLDAHKKLLVSCSHISHLGKGIYGAFSGPNFRFALRAWPRRRPPSYWAVEATVTTEVSPATPPFSKESVTRQIPRFLLSAVDHGLLSESGAVRMAEKILNPNGDPNVKVSASVTEVYSE